MALRIQQKEKRSYTKEEMFDIVKYFVAKYLNDPESQKAFRLDPKIVKDYAERIQTLNKPLIYAQSYNSESECDNPGDYYCKLNRKPDTDNVAIRVYKGWLVASNLFDRTFGFISSSKDGDPTSIKRRAY